MSLPSWADAMSRLKGETRRKEQKYSNATLHKEDVKTRRMNIHIKSKNNTY